MGPENKGRRTFLTARWSYLAMVNYDADPGLLRPLVPDGTELDTWQGRTFVSLVGFLFLDTRVFGLRVPFHRNFEEINLRFYVKRKGPEGWRRGVVFVKEIVPRLAVAKTARLLYGEKYVALPMRHEINAPPDKAKVSADYGFRINGRWSSFGVTATGMPAATEPDSQEEFITEHYWGYTGLMGGGSLEYRVEHPRWLVWRAAEFRMAVDAAAIYGPGFGECFRGEPASAFLAEGSAVAVKMGLKI